MTALRITAVALLLGGVFLAAGLAPRLPTDGGAKRQEGEKADDAPAPEEKKKTRKKADLTLVKVDISEEVDGREFTTHKVQYKAVTILLTGAIDVDSARKTRWDDKLKEYKPRKEGPPDFVVKGEARARMDRRPTWYDGVVAYIYKGEAEITIEDGEGNEVQRFRAELERSAKEREDAITKVIDRLAQLVTKGIVECEPIRKRVHPSREKMIRDIVAKIDAEMAEYGGTIEVLSEGETKPPAGGKVGEGPGKGGEGDAGGGAKDGPSGGGDGSEGKK